MSRWWRVGLVLASAALVPLGCGSASSDVAAKTRPSSSPVAREPTKGPLPPFPAQGGPDTDDYLARVPDYIEIQKDGYVKKCDFGYCRLSRRPVLDGLTVYAPDLHTVVGHFYSGGFVPLGAPPMHLVVPKVLGVTLSEALDALNKAGLFTAVNIPQGVAQIPGSWVVTAQEPPPGTVFPYRSPVRLTCAAPH